MQSISFHDDNTFTFAPHVPLPVDVLGAETISDVAVLRAQFAFDASIPLCPPDEFPTAVQESRVKSYHCPCQMFPEPISALSWMSTGYNTMQMVTDHHMYITGQHMHGSSGGVVVDRMGRAVAVITSGYVPGMGVLSIFSNPFHTVWEAVTALSEGRGVFTKCTKLNAVHDFYGFCASH